MKKVFLIFLMLLALFSARTQVITKMEYFVDTEPGFGNGIDIPVISSADVTASFNINASGLVPGVHMVCVRAMEDNTGGENRVWSAIAASLFITVDLDAVPGIARLEYFIDTDPGYGFATTVPISNEKNISANFSINTGGLVPGLHMVVARVKNTYHEWSVVASSMFYACEPVAGADITQMEYFFDTDPGFGAGNQVPLLPGKDISRIFNVDINGLLPGIHMLSFRTKNSANRWSVVTTNTFLNIDTSVPDIVQMEYFLDTDPGFGEGIQIPIISGKDVSEVIPLDTAGLSLGRHYLVVRAKNQRNAWGIVGYQEFTFFKTKLFLEGLYMPFTGLMYPAQGEFGDQWGPGVADHVTLQFHDPDPPYDVVYQEESELQTNGDISLFITHHLDDSYLGIKHRNSIETWSSGPLQIPSMTAPYDFTGSTSMAFGDNMRNMGDGSFAIWGGDVNQDGIVDGGDMNPVDNASTAITFGYVPEDVNGDGIVDGGDMNIVDNNSTMIIMAYLP
jgi:hypothetical protein